MEYKRWSITFLAKARLRGYLDLIVDQRLSQQKVATYMMSLCSDFSFAELSISIENDVCMGLADLSRSELMPDRNARLL
jgi:hypothetical protein